MSTLFKHRNEIVRFVQDLQKREKNLTSNFSNLSAPEKILWEEVQKAILPDLIDAFTLLETGSRRHGFEKASQVNTDKQWSL